MKKGSFRRREILLLFGGFGTCALVERRASGAVTILSALGWASAAPVRVPKAASPSSLFSRTQQGELVEIVAADVALSEILLSDFHASLSVFADCIVVDGQFSLPGRNINLVARRIEARNGASIDVSAAKTQRTITGRAQDGRSAGERGRDGAAGAPGEAGGNISLFAHSFLGMLSLISRGGDGESGQQGGSGAVGGTGLAGSDCLPGVDSCCSGAPGGTGQKGGTGGTGGSGGAGGNSGIIQVNLLTTVPASAFNVVAEAGNGGEGGVRGDGGPAGAGGVGGMGKCRSDMMPHGGYR